MQGQGAAPGGMSRRELEVVRLVAEGLSGPEVAKRLCRSPRTIEKHIASAYHKLGVRNRVELVHRMQELALLEPRMPATQQPAREQVRGRPLEILRAIDERLASYENHFYFAELALAVADAFGVRWAGLTEIAEGDTLDVIAFASDGKLLGQMTCDRDTSPCGQVLQRGEHVVPDDYARLYPLDNATARFPEIRSFVGVRLDDRLLGPVGTLWIMNDKPLDPSSEPLLVLRLLARRAAPELALAKTLDASGPEPGPGPG